ncbi:MAG TPA: redoxin domain-containing protein [Gemmatimonadaceae bacterium]
MTAPTSSTHDLPKPGLAVGAFLPYLELQSATGRSVQLRSPGRSSTVLVRIHHARCAECLAYLEELSRAVSDFAAWDGRVVVVVPGTMADAERAKAGPARPFTVLADEEHQVPLDGAAVVIADRYDQIYHLAEAGEGHALPSPVDIEDWLRYIATQCPE